MRHCAPGEHHPPMVAVIAGALYIGRQMTNGAL